MEFEYPNGNLLPTYLSVSSVWIFICNLFWWKLHFFTFSFYRAGPIAKALDGGADIVVTGRCADSSLALAPLMHSVRDSKTGLNFFPAIFFPGKAKTKVNVYIDI